MKKRAFFISVFAFLLLACGQSKNVSPRETAAAPDTLTIKVGAEPGCVEVADLNNDKLPDLVVTSQSDSNVTILLGKGKAKFTEADGSPFPAGHNANDVAIGDFDKDGNADLAFANHERKYITVLLGDGAGGFKAAAGSPVPLGGTPHVHGIAAGDFNGDGRLDLVADSWGNDQVEVLFGDSQTLFRTPGIFVKVGKRPYQRHRAGDLDGDGHDDIVTTNLESNNASILLADGKGGFKEPAGSPFSCGDNPFGLAIGDVNADGKPDLAIVNSPGSMAQGRGKNGMTVLLGDGAGAFTMMKGSPFDAGKIPNRIAIGDVNGDGVNDIVSSDNDSDEIYLFLMGANGGLLSAAPVTVGRHPKGVAIADLNGDKKSEIIVCNTLDNNIQIILGK